eukprot:scaffold376508_cov36-Prasinocladus_malaysianus.AAC.1
MSGPAASSGDLMAARGLATQEDLTQTAATNIQGGHVKGDTSMGVRVIDAILDSLQVPLLGSGKV